MPRSILCPHARRRGPAKSRRPRLTCIDVARRGSHIRDSWQKNFAPRGDAKSRVDRTTIWVSVAIENDNPRNPRRAPICRRGGLFHSGGECLVRYIQMARRLDAAMIAPPVPLLYFAVPPTGSAAAARSSFDCQSSDSTLGAAVPQPVAQAWLAEAASWATGATHPDRASSMAAATQRWNEDTAHSCHQGWRRRSAAATRMKARARATPVLAGHQAGRC